MTIVEACFQVRKPMLIGMLIIIGTYLPILTLSGVEGRMFRSLAQSVILVLVRSLLLTITLVPALCTIGLRRSAKIKEPRFLQFLRFVYERLFRICRRFRWRSNYLAPDYDQLDSLAGKASEIIKKIPDAGEVVVDRPARTDALEFVPNPTQTLRYMVTVDQINNAISIGLAGRQVERIDEGDIFYPLVVRAPESFRTNIDKLNLLPVRSADSSLVIGLGDVGKWRTNRLSVSSIIREQAERREAIMVTVNDPDIVGFVSRARKAIQNQLKLPAGYRLEFSGSYKNWQSGSQKIAGRWRSIRPFKSAAGLYRIQRLEADYFSYFRHPIRFDWRDFWFMVT
jgi:Cu/Ag efflux pump CusA